MAAAAIEDGFEVAVATNASSHVPVLESAGVRVIPFDMSRRSFRLVTALGAALTLGRILRLEKPDVIHCISLRPILIGGVAATIAGINRRIFALTGGGFFFANSEYST